MGSAVGFMAQGAVNGDFETRPSSQSKSRDRFSGSGRPAHRVPAHFSRPVRRPVDAPSQKRPDSVLEAGRSQVV